MSAIRSLAIQTCRAIAPTAIDLGLNFCPEKMSFSRKFFIATVCGVGTLGYLLCRKASTTEKIVTAAIYTALKAAQVYFTWKDNRPPTIRMLANRLLDRPITAQELLLISNLE